MKVGRNDPCPCGSGRKYKNCHMMEDQQALAGETSSFGARRDFDDPELDLAGLDLGDPDLAFADDELGITEEELGALLSAAAAQDSWQADLVPLPTRIEEDPAARPAALLVTSGPIPLHVEVLAHPPSEPGAVARLLEQGLQVASRQTGKTPLRLEVRHAEVARHLAEALAERGIAVDAAASLPMLDMLIQSMTGHLSRMGDDLPMSVPESWEEWGLPREQIAGIFRAAAAFYRAEPWRQLTNLQLLHATLPEGRTWVACILGNGGEQFGLVLYADLADFVRQVQTEDPAASFLALQGPVLSLTFEHRNELPRPMQKEIAAAGWEIASPRAYPLLITFNTPGGIAREQARELTDLLRSIPRFTDEFEEVLSGEEEAELPLEWRDPDTGITLRYEGFLLPREAGIWDIAEELSPAAAEGPGARPEAALEFQDPEKLQEAGMKFVARFGRRLRRTKLKPDTVERHLANSELFIEFLSGYQGIPLEAVTEYDLRVFLYDWYPRKVADSRTRALAVPVSLRRFFAYLAEEEGISCPWADEILLDKDSFELRYDEFPGGFWWDEDVQDWQTELYDDLDARVMLPDRGMAGGGSWGPTMGIEEAQLERELHRRWLLWRDEVIRSGATDPEAVRAALVHRQRQWEQTPREALGGQTPVQAIAAERREQEKQEKRRGR